MWVVTQTLHSAGERVAYITDGAVKLTSPVGGWSMITSAPQWDVTVFNTGSKTWFRSSREKYLSSFIGRANMVSSVLTPAGGAWQKTNDRSKVLGVNAVRYQYVDKLHPNQHTTFNCWLAEDIPFSTAASELSYQFMGAPTKGLLPLRLIATGLKSIPFDKKAVIVDTTEVKRISIPPDFFKMPTGYRLAKSAVEVMIGLDGNGFMNDFTGMFDQPEKSKSRK